VPSDEQVPPSLLSLWFLLVLTSSVSFVVLSFRDVVSVITGGFGTSKKAKGTTDMSIYEGEHTEVTRKMKKSTVSVNDRRWSVLCVSVFNQLTLLEIMNVSSASVLFLCVWMKINVDQCATMLAESESIIIVPGYGLAVAKAQYAIADMVKNLIARGVKVLDMWCSECLQF
jgi:NAD/NADP transhydrogenase beta subunit